MAQNSIPRAAPATAAPTTAALLAAYLAAHYRVRLGDAYARMGFTSGE